VVDLENDPYRDSNRYGLSHRRMIASIAGFTVRARAMTGKPPIIYTSASWWRQWVGATGRFKAGPLWMAS
jgi:GH25 family lysozyme M1 (1,4-beta-N-acetylmuramidase)